MLTDIIHIHKVKYDNIYNNIDETFNHYALIEALSNYIGIHDLFILSMLSNKFKSVIMLLWHDIINNVNTDLIDIINHQCFQCFDRLKKYDDVSNELLAICKVGSDKMYKNYNIKLILRSNVLHQCVYYAIGNRSYYIVEKLTKYSYIDNVETLKLICQFYNEKIINQIINQYTFRMPNVDLFKTILPILCAYNKLYTIIKWEELLTVNECELVYNLFKQYDDVKLKNILALRYLNITPIIPTLVLDELINWFSIHGELREIKYIKSKYKNLAIHHLILLTDQFYKYHYHADLTYLNHSIEYNLLSITLATKYNRSIIYIDKLSNNIIINLLPNIDDYLLKILIKRLKIDTPLTTEQINILYNKVKNTNIYNLYFNMIHIPIQYKLEFAPMLYKKHLSQYATFLSETREYNILSIELAAIHPYDNVNIYDNHLTLNDKISYIKKYKNYHVIFLLMQNIETDELICDENCQYYTDKHNTYTLKLTQFNKEYCEWVLQCNIISYQQLVYLYFINIKLDKSYKLYNYDFIMFIIHHQEFKNINKLIVLLFIKYYSIDNDVVSQLMSFF